MKRSTNASPTMYGFDFQVNAAIVLMLDNIKELEKLRLEGETEDIEITLKNGEIIYAQAKAVVDGGTDFKNVRKKASDAIKTLSKADNDKVKELILITNSANPLNDYYSKGIFYMAQEARRKYSDLPKESQKIIDDIVDRLNISFDISKFVIRFFRFETDDDFEKYKYVRQKTVELLCKINSSVNISCERLLDIWQKVVFRNGTSINVKITLSKKQIIWPIIVLGVGEDVAPDLLNDFDQGLADEIIVKYRELINNSTERYDIVTKVLYEFKNAFNGCTYKDESVKNFINEY